MLRLSIVYLYARYITGLQVVLNIDQEEYVMQMGEEAGVRAVIHHQDKMPFPEDEGIMAKPGFMTAITISLVPS